MDGSFEHIKNYFGIVDAISDSQIVKAFAQLVQLLHCPFNSELLILWESILRGKVQHKQLCHFQAKNSTWKLYTQG